MRKLAAQTRAPRVGRVERVGDSLMSARILAVDYEEHHVQARVRLAPGGVPLITSDILTSIHIVTGRWSYVRESASALPRPGAAR